MPAQLFNPAGSPVELRVANSAGDFTTESVLGYLAGSDKQSEAVSASAQNYLATKQSAAYCPP